MSNNFLQIEPGEKGSGRWRYIVGGGGLFVGIIIGLFVSGAIVPLVSTNVVDIGTFAKKTFPFAKERIGAAEAGGDVVVEPIDIPPIPEKIGETIVPEKLTAAGVVVRDVVTGKLLYEKNAHEPRPMASITKLMSALVLLEKNPDWTAVAQVVPDDVVDTQMYVGDTYTLEELWRAALIGSSNKAILTLAHALDWPIDAFIARMNQKAIELGMRDTQFTDPSGLDETNISTPADAALLLNESLLNEKIRNTLLIREHNLYSRERQKAHHVWNTNWLLLGWIPHTFARVEGGKTGYIPAAGYNFTVRVEDSAGHLLDIVVFGALNHEARFTEARDAAVSVFQAYRWPE